MQKIRIGHLSTAYHTSLIIQGKRWVEKNMNLKPVWTLFGGGPGIVEAFERGELDIGYIGLPPTIIGIDRGVPIKCVAGGHVEGTVLIALKKYKSLRECEDLKATLEQLRGGTIGAPPKGSIHDVIIRETLREYGLEITIKNYPWADFIPGALERGEIEAAVGTPALAVAAGDTAKIAVPPDKLWPYNPSYGIVVSEEIIRNSPQIVEEYLRLHRKANAFIREHPEKASRVVSQVLEVVDEKFVLDVYRVSPKYCTHLSKEFISSTLRFIPVLKRLKYISRSLTEEDIFDTRFIQKLHPELPHYV
jgi:NitT/TauT family transport system substrate-binding protein